MRGESVRWLLGCERCGGRLTDDVYTILGSMGVWLESGALGVRLRAGIDIPLLRALSLHAPLIVCTYVITERSD